MSHTVRTICTDCVRHSRPAGAACFLGPIPASGQSTFQSLFWQLKCRTERDLLVSTCPFLSRKACVRPYPVSRNETSLLLAPSAFYAAPGSASHPGGPNDSKPGQRSRRPAPWVTAPTTPSCCPFRTLNAGDTHRCISGRSRTDDAIQYSQSPLHPRLTHV